MNLVERVKRILLTPRAEWEVIHAEATTPRALYTGYIMPLAAIGPLALVIRLSVFGLRVPFGGAVYRVPIGSLATSTVVRPRPRAARWSASNPRARAAPTISRARTAVGTRLSRP